MPAISRMDVHLAVGKWVQAFEASMVLQKDPWLLVATSRVTNFIYLSLRVSKMETTIPSPWDC